MNIIRKLTTTIIMGLFVLLFANPVFAQEETSDDTNSTIVTRSGASSASSESSESSEYSQTVLINYDWGRESRIYKGVGWGMLGFGLALDVAGIVVAFHAHNDYKKNDPRINNSDGGDDYDYEKQKEQYDKDKVAVNAGYALIGVGSAFVITGVALLIAEAVKFGPYKRGEVANGFSWQPEFYASPELTGFGFSGRF